MLDANVTLHPVTLISTRFKRCELTKIYYLELLRALEGTLSRWSRLHLQSLTPPPVSKKIDVKQAAGRKNNCRIYSQHDYKNMLYRPHLLG
jgi:hypothetical protein